jgi:UDP-3-O-[3-hydroxymyristoyl] glucosamine N-acyltransferase
MKHSTIPLYNIISFLESKMRCSVFPKSYDNFVSISKIIKLDIENTDPYAMFWVSEKNISSIQKIKTGIILAPFDNKVDCDFSGIIVSCENPRRAFSLILNQFYNEEFFPFQIKNSTLKSSIPSTSIIGAGTIIEDDVTIGNNVVIGYNNVILRGTVIKDNVRIGSNNTIGGVGFGYDKGENGEWERIVHLGNVLIEEDVEIGNNNTIDRAVLGSTILGKNCKIDNLVHVAHGVIIGENSLIIANSMIAGSTIIGENTWIAPSTSVINGSKIGSNSMTGLGAVVTGNVENNSLVVGVPAKKIKNI